MEGWFWFVELSGPGVRIGDRAAWLWDRALSRAKCDAGNSQNSRHRIRKRSGCCPDRRNICTAYTVDRQGYCRGCLDLLYALCRYGVLFGEDREKEANYSAVIVIV